MATVLATAVAVGGCGGDRDQTAMTADLERDLQLAVTAQPVRTQVVSVIEGGPPNAPSGDKRGRREAVAVRRQAPKPQPSPEIQEVPALADLDESAAPAVAITERVEPTAAPVPEPSLEAPSPDIAAMPTSGPSAEGGSSGEATGRRGGGWGRAIGVIIRGAAAGIDHCEAHDRAAGRRRGGGMDPIGGIAAGAGRGIPGGFSGPLGGVIANRGPGGGFTRAGPRY